MKHEKCYNTINIKSEYALHLNASFKKVQKKRIAEYRHCLSQIMKTENLEGEYKIQKQIQSLPTAMM